MIIRSETNIKNLINTLSSTDKVYCFGAGNMGKDICDYAQSSGLDLHQVIFVDNDNKKHGKFVDLNNNKLIIISKEKMIESIKPSDIIIVATIACKEIYDDLQLYENLNNVSVYFSQLLYLSKINQLSKIKLDTKNHAVIPKIIHYFWFGKSEIPNNFKKNIEGWAKKCPDYKIMRWDESNYDVTKNKYMHQAYEQKRWGFVPDYARLDVVYEYGGIYLDTDVEIVNSLDALLHKNAFFSYNSSLKVNAGNGFGAMPKHNLIKKMRDYYYKALFIDKNGVINATPCMEYQYEVLKNEGFSITGEFFEREDYSILPFDMACGYNHYLDEYVINEHAFTVHHSKRSWHDDIMRQRASESVEFLNNILKK